MNPIAPFPILTITGDPLFFHLILLFLRIRNRSSKRHLRRSQIPPYHTPLCIQHDLILRLAPRIDHGFRGNQLGKFTASTLRGRVW
jgi:hypothetical protein